MRIAEFFTGIFRFRAWRAAYFTANVHIYFLAIFYLLLITDFARSSLDTVALTFIVLIYLSYGFLVNDYFDLPYDIMAGKDHGLGKIPRSQIVALLALLLLLAFVLAVLTTHDWIFTAVLALSFLLSTLYSAPPFRLKGRGMLGFICDSTIEKPLPVLIAFAFFQHYGIDTISFVVLADTIQFHSVLNQQIDDFDADVRTGVRTFVTRIGELRSRKILRYAFYPLNVVTIILFILTIAAGARFAILGIVLGSLTLFIGLLVLTCSKSNQDIRNEIVAESGPLYRSSRIPVTIAYLNVGFEGLIVSILALYVVVLSFHFAPLVFLYLGSLYYYTGVYFVLGSYFLTKIIRTYTPAH